MTNPYDSPIFIGGYTKSGTTYVGRVFDTINGVYARGELDFFRQILVPFNKVLVDYNENTLVVNKEVYDGFGTLEPVTNSRARTLHRDIFYSLFFNGREWPKDCQVVVEKSPRNIFHLPSIRFVFPKARFVCVYREPKAVYRSLMRHLGDHRSDDFRDPSSQIRRDFLESFIVDRWKAYHQIISENSGKIFLVRYDEIVADTAGFLDFAEQKVIGTVRGRKRGIETLTKDYYLSQLPPEVRQKSLVQTGNAKISLSDEEAFRIDSDCQIPTGPFNF